MWDDGFPKRHGEIITKVWVNDNRAKEDALLRMEINNPNQRIYNGADCQDPDDRFSAQGMCFAELFAKLSNKGRPLPKTGMGQHDQQWILTETTRSGKATWQ